ncbi:MAG TPA: GGDEF domain-containing protein [Gemmatimonadaceae bacterium]|nr:GGDEF domain-containing protein [Gemmatimonadaceae bacterium]
MPDPRELPPELVTGLLRLCEGDFSFRLPRTGTRDDTDTAAFFVNAIAEELERIMRTSQEQEKRLADFVQSTSEMLIRVAAGDLTAQLERDFAGDPPDVLAYLVNNTVAELGAFVAATQRRADEDRLRLEALVLERTRELDRLVGVDILTEAYNRRRLEELGRQEIGRAARFGDPLCVLMLDLDHFKSINDTFGHSVGDTALQMAAAAIRSRVRAYDHVGRYGGEEFVIVAPGTPLAGAVRLADAVRDAIAAVEFDAIDGPVTITTSVGIAEWAPGEALESVIARADAAMYRAKEMGRNCAFAAEAPAAG